MLSIHNFFRGKVSVSLKIALYISFAFSIILILITLMVISSVHIFLMNESEQFLLYNENIIRNELKNSLEGERLLLDELPFSRKVQISVYSIEGVLLYEKNRMYDDALISRDGIEEIHLPEGSNYERIDQAGDFNETHFMVLRDTVDGSNSKYIIQITKDLSAEDYFLYILKKFLILTNIAGLIISIAAGFLISQRILKPITQVTNTALKISERDLDARIPDNGANDELQHLAVAFNGMLDRLDDAFKRQKSLVSDASHELRTPISIINGYVGILSRWGKSDPEVLGESLMAIKSETERMASLIDKLLFLAQNENGALILDKSPVDLGMILNGLKKDVGLLFPERQFEFKIPGEYTILGNEEMLRRMFLIFLDNAGKYSCKDKKVSFSIDRVMENFTVTVRDGGPGIDKAKLKYIFDRFYRLDESRNKGLGGTGLGLSIAKEIIGIHGGSVSVESEKGKGTIFKISFPVNA